MTTNGAAVWCREFPDQAGLMAFVFDPFVNENWNIFGTQQESLKSAFEVCFPKLLLYNVPWKSLFMFHGMHAVIVARVSTLESDKKTTLENERTGPKVAIVVDSVLISGSFQIIDDAVADPPVAYVWNVCKTKINNNNNTMKCGLSRGEDKYSSRFLFEAVRMYLSRVRPDVRMMSLNVDLTSPFCGAAIKSYLAYGFAASERPPLGLDNNNNNNNNNNNKNMNLTDQQYVRFDTSIV
jgi:hypothetical protein